MGYLSRWQPVLGEVAHGLLLVTDWMSVTFWTFLAPDGIHFAWGFKFFVRFRPSGFEVEDGILSGTFRGVPNFNIFGIEFDFFKEEDDFSVSVLAASNCVLGGCMRCF